MVKLNKKLNNLQLILEEHAKKRKLTNVKLDKKDNYYVILVLTFFLNDSMVKYYNLE